MRILADENMLERAVASLRADGHDVLWAAEANRSAADPNLLELATQEGRTLITFDKDFGDLVFLENLPAPFGILLFRLHRGVPEPVQADFIAGAATAWDTWPPGIWTIQIRHQTHPLLTCCSFPRLIPSLSKGQGRESLKSLPLSERKGLLRQFPGTRSVGPWIKRVPYRHHRPLLVMDADFQHWPIDKLHRNAPLIIQ